MYIADAQNSRIRRMGTNGVITTVAGNGNFGCDGDGGVATGADLDAPSGVTLDTLGNLYITDSPGRIREVLLYAGNPTLVLGQVSAPNAGNYTVVITNVYGSVTSLVASLTVLSPPMISVQPASQVVLSGSNVTLNVTATGTAPLNYSWYLDATNLIQSGTNNVLLIAGASMNNAGAYTVTVTNAYGRVTSQVSVLKVGLPLTVVTQPRSQTNFVGTMAIFNVTAGGSGPFTCQWQFNGTNLPNNIITTVAGDASAGYAGDGRAATNASLDLPAGMALAASGNLYIADTENSRIRMVDGSGIIHTAAGKTGSGYSGDGGAATNALLYWPSGVALGAAGNLYIEDAENDRVRMEDGNGIIHTIAGKTGAGYSGDGSAATNALLYFPSGVALDGLGNLFIADTYNNRIRKVATNGIITTVAGKSGAGFAGDGGVATNANLNQPAGVALDASGNLLIADSSNNRIRKVATNGIITTVAGDAAIGYAGDGGAATNASLAQPGAVAFDAAGNMYIADSGNGRIRRVATNGLIATVAGNGGSTYSGDGGAATNASLYHAAGVAVDATGNLYIADEGNQRIREVHFTGLPALALANLGFPSAGNYTVIITSPFGSVTSVVASLTVTIPTSPPQIIARGANFGFQTNIFGFDFLGADGQTIVIDGSTDLVTWLPLFTNTANGSPFYFLDPAWTNFPNRFYRARLP